VETTAPPEDTRAEEVEYLRHLLQRAKKLIRREFSDTTWRAFEAQVNGRNTDDVAAELGMSRAAAYVAKCRVLARLRQEASRWID
jgi:RNA polymerase sigma-70 factor (ECF subfamily)